MKIAPPYSCLELKPKADGVLIKGKLKHYGGNREKQQKKLGDTANMLHLLSTNHGEGGFSSKQEQNN